jgi:hypothetical protein
VTFTSVCTVFAHGSVSMDVLKASVTCRKVRACLSLRSRHVLCVPPVSGCTCHVVVRRDPLGVCRLGSVVELAMDVECVARINFLVALLRKPTVRFYLTHSSLTVEIIVYRLFY